MEYTGQCRGGPDDGNLISSTVEEVPFRVEYMYHLDGPDQPPSATVVTGSYCWDPIVGGFNWMCGKVMV